MTKARSLAQLLSARPPRRPPLTEKEQDTVAAIREYFDNVVARFGRNAAWIVAARLQQTYGPLVGHALGFLPEGVIIAHTFYDPRKRHVRIIDSGQDG
jgi:hypothetical protein